MELSEVRKNFALVKTRIRDPQVTLIAVSKTKPFEMIQTLYDLGHRDFGENYAQELAEKAEFAQLMGLKEIRWHFIGHLQSNKIKVVVPWASAIHAIDSLERAREVQKRVELCKLRTAEKLKLFIEINIDDEPTKAGMSPAQFRSLSPDACDEFTGVAIAGLMCIPRADQSDPAAPFKKLRELSRHRPTAMGNALSMGMSADFEAAIEQGATHVRVGSLIFGER